MIRLFDWQRYVRGPRRRWGRERLTPLKAAKPAGVLLTLACTGSMSVNDAQAAPITMESDVGDFGDDFVSAFDLASDTRTVVGSFGFVPGRFDHHDFVRYVDLPGGTAFTLDFEFTVSQFLASNAGAFEISAFDESNIQIAFGRREFSTVGETVSGQLGGTLPATDTLVLHMSSIALTGTEGFVEGPYSVTLNAVPEPGSLGLALLGGAGLLGAGALRRRKREAVAAPAVAD